MTNAQETEGEWKGQATASKQRCCHRHKDDLKPSQENSKGEE